MPEPGSRSAMRDFHVFRVRAAELTVALSKSLVVIDDDYQ
jgi:hypothetical protein